MRNQYGVTIAIIATVLGTSAPAFADSVRDDLSAGKNTPPWQVERAKKMPPDVVMENGASSNRQYALEKLPAQHDVFSGKNFGAGLHK